MASHLRRKVLQVLTLPPRREVKRLLGLLAICLLLFCKVAIPPYSCLDTVRGVKEALLKIGGGGNICKVLISSTEEECLTFQQHNSPSDDCEAVARSIIPAGEEEREVSLAFSILAHRDVHQLRQLLRAIYRSHNLYCIQLDSKSPQFFVAEVLELVKCYQKENKNIFLSSRNISLIWQHSSLLEGDLMCLEQLLAVDHPWMYYVNIVGSEFPLMTNLELVRKLKTVKNGVGFVDTKHPHEEVKSRWIYSHQLYKESSQMTSYWGGYYKNVPYRTKLLKEAPPHNITVMYGLKNAAITRKFSQYCIESAIAKDVRLWLSDALVAVEHFYPSLALHYIREEDGPESAVIQELNRFHMRKTFWYSEIPCYGEVKREICVLSIQDLPNILKVKSAFIMNKFDSELDASVVECIREILYG